MKKIISLFLCLISLTLSAQEKFTIECGLTGINDGVKIELLPSSTHKQEKAIAESVVKNGKISFQGELLEARMFMIMQKELKIYIKVLVSPGDKIIVSGDPKKPIIKGATLQSKYVELFEKDRSMLNNAHATKDPKDKEADVAFFKLVEETIVKAIRANKDTWWGPFLMLEHMSYFTEEQKEWYNWLSEEAKNSYYGKLVYAELFPPDLVGKSAPNFRAKDVNGKEYSLSDLIKGNKYILIDFWASWCGPCRKSMPELKKIAEKYASDGLVIVGISCDKDRNEWIKALDKDQLPWINLNDTSGIMDAYAVKTIPALFLIDTNGIVLGDKLHGESLTKCLSKVLGK